MAMPARMISGRPVREARHRPVVEHWFKRWWPWRLLAAEERGRKLCGISLAPAFGRMWVFVAGVRVRLHNLAIQVPSRVTEHRHHHGEADEQRQGADHVGASRERGASRCVLWITL